MLRGLIDLVGRTGPRALSGPWFMIVSQHAEDTNLMRLAMAI